VLGAGPDIQVSVPGEVVPAAEFYNYDAKYHNAESKTVIPAPIPDDITELIQQMAADIFKAVDGSGLARVDFFLDEKNRVIFNELNTVPGFTSISLFSKAWEASGIPFTDLLDILIEIAAR